MSALARWTTTDPAGQYASPYVYAGNDPVNVVDPTGLYGAGCRGTCGPVRGFDEDGRDTPQEVWNRMHADEKEGDCPDCDEEDDAVSGVYESEIENRSALSWYGLTVPAGGTWAVDKGVRLTSRAASIRGGLTLWRPIRYLKGSIKADVFSLSGRTLSGAGKFARYTGTVVTLLLGGMELSNELGQGRARQAAGTMGRMSFGLYASAACRKTLDRSETSLLSFNVDMQCWA